MNDKKLLSIGEFSNITGLSNQTLIYYDNLGLLKPDYTNRENGYRYYDQDSMYNALNIKFWQSMDLSLEEIMNLSEETVISKVHELGDKYHAALSNLNLLRDLNEKGYNLKNAFDLTHNIFGKDKTALPICGEWIFDYEVENLSELFTPLSRKNQPSDNAPQKLFFGETICSDGTSDPWYKVESKKFIRNNGADKEEGYQYFFLAKDKFVIYDLQGTPKAFRVYRKPYSDTILTDEDIKNLYRRAVKKKEITENLMDLSKDKCGLYVMYDKLFQDQVDSYDGKKKKENVQYLFPCLYSILDIKEDGTCYTMKEDDSLRIVDKKKGDSIVNREVSKMKMMQYKENGNILCGKGKMHNNCLGKYSKIGNDEFIFLNLDMFPELTSELYVFKKQK